MLSVLDPDADGGFADVERADWFYDVTGSSRRNGIIAGSEEMTRGDAAIVIYRLYQKIW